MSGTTTKDKMKGQTDTDISFIQELENKLLPPNFPWLHGSHVHKVKFHHERPNSLNNALQVTYFDIMLSFTSVNAEESNNNVPSFIIRTC